LAHIYWEAMGWATAVAVALLMVLNWARNRYYRR
jgi:hypothetical protein